MNDIERRLIVVVAEHFGVNENLIDSETRFVEDLGLDTDDVNIVYDLVMDVEDEFDIDVEDEDIKDLLTIKAAADYIEERIDD